MKHFYMQWPVRMQNMTLNFIFILFLPYFHFLALSFVTVTCMAQRGKLAQLQQELKGKKISIYFCCFISFCFYFQTVCGETKRKALWKAELVMVQSLQSKQRKGHCLLSLGRLEQEGVCLWEYRKALGSDHYLETKSRTSGYMDDIRESALRGTKYSIGGHCQEAK